MQCLEHHLAAIATFGLFGELVDFATIIREWGRSISGFFQESTNQKDLVRDVLTHLTVTKSQTPRPSPSSPYNRHSAAKLDKVGTRNVGAINGVGMMHGLGMHFGDGRKSSMAAASRRSPTNCSILSHAITLSCILLCAMGWIGGFDVQNFLDSDSRHGTPLESAAIHEARRSRHENT
jgi:hypothetical protein